ncbi:hypothetical protein G4V62_09400 [Bacillaceae bacterium SIJ1]|uniref:hypothetical protein n=1 Tax=Litoribacterium kuwaitense TaxID=1398745 RepID=UPI0013ECDAE8|nr:hypothetical protein [Litoribacterium kuwaitense]NGP45161.1 hypothetical protein [Litoribacterium kuwaitense]
MRKKSILHCLLICLFVVGAACSKPSSEGEIETVNDPGKDGDRKNESITPISKNAAQDALQNIKNPVELNEQLLNDDNKTIIEAFIQIEDWTNDSLALNELFQETQKSYIDDAAREQIKQKLKVYHSTKHIEQLISFYYPENPEYISEEDEGKVDGLYEYRATESWGGTLDYVNKNGTFTNVNVSDKGDHVIVTIEGKYEQIEDIHHFKRVFTLKKHEGGESYVIDHTTLDDPQGNFPSLPF